MQVYGSPDSPVNLFEIFDLLKQSLRGTRVIQETIILLNVYYKIYLVYYVTQAFESGLTLN